MQSCGRKCAHSPLWPMALRSILFNSRNMSKLVYAGFDRAVAKFESSFGTLFRGTPGSQKLDTYMHKYDHAPFASNLSEVFTCSSYVRDLNALTRSSTIAQTSPGVAPSTTSSSQSPGVILKRGGPCPDSIISHVYGQVFPGVRVDANCRSLLNPTGHRNPLLPQCVPSVKLPSS